MIVKSQLPQPFKMDRNTVYINSDTYFNDPSSHDFFDAVGIDAQPVDAFGGLVPKNKSLANLKKCEKAIQERFGLEKPGRKGSEK